MKIAVMGAGGIGGCYGGLLAQAGNDVTLIARGAHLAAIKEKGLQLIQPEGDFTVAVAATDDPSQVGPVELVIFSVKAHQNSKAVPLIEPLIGEDTTILTIQNGVESAEELGQDYGAERVLPGSAYLLSNITSPGVIKQLSLVPRVAFGESNGDRSQRAVAIRDSFCEANIEAELSDDISKALWSKLLYNSPANAMASAARLSPRDLIEYPHGAAMFRSAIQEVANVGTAYGIPFGQDDVQGAMDLITARPMGARGSMQADLEAGRPLELEAIVGSVRRIGRKVNVPTPVFDMLYTLLLPHIDGSPESR
ncbi:MAG: 2-dehydropantoate 2-reductase [SAR202 cluster bacterium]|nr:2-dehydropantoate 2-reductase [SAR202 cluster bacterium]MQG71153.1 2-dehydropantoate 2-reductase [SAR202 cluster bacterium]